MSLPPMDIGIVHPKILSIPALLSSLRQNPCSKPSRLPLKPDWLKRKNNDNKGSWSMPQGIGDGVDLMMAEEGWGWLISLGAFSYSRTDGHTEHYCVTGPWQAGLATGHWLISQSDGWPAATGDRRTKVMALVWNATCYSPAWSQKNGTLLPICHSTSTSC